MITTGRMSYGNLPHPEIAPPQIAPPRRPWRAGVLILVIGLVLGLTSGWIGQNWRTFDSRADSSLCRLLDDRC